MKFIIGLLNVFWGREEEGVLRRFVGESDIKLREGLFGVRLEGRG